MTQSDAEHGWPEAQAYRAEHEHLTAATQHVARSVAELQRAIAEVGDHSAAVQLVEVLENLQILQAQLASAAERALSRARIAARWAQQDALQRQVNAATRSTRVAERDLPAADTGST